MSTADGAAQPFVALVLQGGGALGAYHVGTFRALVEAGFTPQWVTGTSIGSINAAIIAGNRPADQLTQLEHFWEIVARPSSIVGEFIPPALLRLYNYGSAFQALTFGQPNFSVPFFINPYLAPAGTPAATALYDNTPLKETLARISDFDYINQGAVRLTIGVTKVRTGNLLFFDSSQETITPEHVVASSSIPPFYPAARVNGELFWDGGIVDNTPLDPVLDDQDQHPGRDTLVFMIDLWNGRGPEPRTLDEVVWRQNSIQFASRTERQLREMATRENLRRSMLRLAQMLPPEQRPADIDFPPVFPDGSFFQYGNLDIVRVIYEPSADQTSLSYVDFSISSIQERIQAGYSDMLLALSEAPWKKARTADTGTPSVLGSGDAALPTRAAVHLVRQGQIETSYPGMRQE